MAKEHMKRYSTSLATRLVKIRQIKTMIRYHYTHIRMAKYKIVTQSNAGKDKEYWYVAGGNVKWKAIMANSLAVLTKHATNIQPAIVLSGIYPKEMKICVYIKSTTWLFTGALFITG